MLRAVPPLCLILLVGVAPGCTSAGVGADPVSSGSSDAGTSSSPPGTSGTPPPPGSTDAGRVPLPPTHPDGGSGGSASVGEISSPNQAVLAFPPNAPDLNVLATYAHPGGMVVIDPYLLQNLSHQGRDFIQSFQAAGGEVLLYVDLMEVEDYAVSDPTRWSLFQCAHTGSCAASMPSAWFFPHFVKGALVKLSNYANSYMTDITAGSAFSNNVVSYLGSWDRMGAKGLFLDVLGTRLWSSAWGQMSASEQQAWTAGAQQLVSRIRAAVGDSAILVANNDWTSGHAALNGICVEHHDIGEAAYWTHEMTALPYHAGRRHIIIATSAAQAQQWRNVQGPTDITAQSDYSTQTAAVSGWPFTAPH